MQLMTKLVEAAVAETLTAIETMCGEKAMVPDFHFKVAMTTDSGSLHVLYESRVHTDGDKECEAAARATLANLVGPKADVYTDIDPSRISGLWGHDVKGAKEDNVIIVVALTPITMAEEVFRLLMARCKIAVHIMLHAGVYATAYLTEEETEERELVGAGT